MIYNLIKNKFYKISAIFTDLNNKKKKICSKKNLINIKKNLNKPKNFNYNLSKFYFLKIGESGEACLAPNEKI